jgi:UDP-N-acetylmuramyl pentapeptide phosphotransferase/UDP-N-acetylglucosamine-1-phosphate transferase
LLAGLKAGDVVMIKGSLGSRMGPLVEAMKAQSAAGQGDDLMLFLPAHQPHRRVLGAQRLPLSDDADRRAILTALLFVFLFGPRIISLLKVKQGRGQPIRSDGPQRHIVEKQGTPTMGGLMILSGIFVATSCGRILRNLYVWAVLFVMLGFGAIGFYDDFLKVTKASTKGFSGKAAAACGIRHRRAWLSPIFMWIGDAAVEFAGAVPFFKDLLLPISAPSSFLSACSWWWARAMP